VFTILSSSGWQFETKMQILIIGKDRKLLSLIAQNTPSIDQILVRQELLSNLVAD
jgi:hypothetical protein